jgi:hypothetical protein
MSKNQAQEFMLNLCLKKPLEEIHTKDLVPILQAEHKLHILEACIGPGDKRRFIFEFRDRSRLRVEWSQPSVNGNWATRFSLVGNS